MKIKIIENNEEKEIDISKGYLGDVFSISIEGNTVSFREECDRYYYVEMDKKEAIKTLNYFIDYIKNYSDANTI